MDADLQVQALVLALGAEIARRFAHADRGSDCAIRRLEGRHHRIANGLHDGALFGAYDLLKQPEMLSLQERLAKLAGGVAVIRVGGATEVEVKERKDRVDDAMHATRAAVEEGILPGGGVALLRSVKALGKLKTENHDQKTGIDIVRKALSTPARQIAINAGEDGSIVVGKISENDSLWLRLRCPGRRVR